MKGSIDDRPLREFELVHEQMDYGLTLIHIPSERERELKTKLEVNGMLAVGDVDISGDEFEPIPRDSALAKLASIVSVEKPALFSLVVAEYFGGIGEQAACVNQGNELVEIGGNKINDALRYLGVVKVADKDEFDVLGLARFR